MNQEITLYHGTLYLRLQEHFLYPHLDIAEESLDRPAIIRKVQDLMDRVQGILVSES